MSKDSSPAIAPPSTRRPKSWQGFDNVTLYADSSFAFKFTPYSMIDGKLDGTFALTKSIVQVKFSAEVTSAYEDMTQPITTTYSLYEITGYEYVPTGSGGITIDDTVYRSRMSPLTSPPTSPDASSSTIRSGTATIPTSVCGPGAPAPMEPARPSSRSGVDEFGAVMVINVDDDASDTIGLIPIADSIGTDEPLEFPRNAGRTAHQLRRHRDQERHRR
ncbi:MAG: hypothetical protein MZU97_10080 [Bacillus subtilis]|nr:hypothetical protein [Bacillus subtilis]